MTIDTMVQAVRERITVLDNKQQVLISIDGPCGSGKTTLAKKLSVSLDAPVIHLDDFSIPHARKTAERLSIPGGNLDVERFCEEFLFPWKETGTASYRPYDCHEDSFSSAITVPVSRYTIVEGSYATLPEIAAQVDLHLFLRISPELQQKRLLCRVGAERLKQFNARWIPLEQAYFAAYRLPDERCVCLDTQDETFV